MTNQAKNENDLPEFAVEVVSRKTPPYVAEVAAEMTGSNNSSGDHLANRLTRSGDKGISHHFVNKGPVFNFVCTVAIIFIVAILATLAYAIWLVIRAAYFANAI